MLTNQEEGRNSQFLYGCNTDWNIDVEFVYWLRYWMGEYLKETKGKVDLSYHKFKYRGKELTQEEIIKKIIENCNEYIESDPWLNSDEKTIDEIFELFRIVFDAMWW